MNNKQQMAAQIKTLKQDPKYLQQQNLADHNHLL